jgi:hypothetical protein
MPAALVAYKGLTFIVPFRPGGGFDLQARILAPFLEKQLPSKVNVVIKNVSGAGGKTGIMEIGRSKPDGYTIGIVGQESVAFMRAMGDLDVDIREWSWLGQISSDPLMVAIPSAGKYKTLVRQRRVRLPDEGVRPVLFDARGCDLAIAVTWTCHVPGPPYERVRDSTASCRFGPPRAGFPLSRTC